MSETYIGWARDYYNREALILARKHTPYRVEVDERGIIRIVKPALEQIRGQELTGMINSSMA